MSAQSAINARVGAWFRLTALAAVFNLVLGLMILTVVALLEVNASKSEPRMKLLAWKERPPLALLLLPGALGAVYVTSGVILVPAIGAALFFVSIVMGQILTAAGFDHVGFGGAERKPLTYIRGAALVLAIVGAFLTVAERVFGGAANAEPVGIIGAASASATIVGGLTVYQANLSRRASLLLPSRIAAVWWSFAVSATLSVIACGVQALAEPDARTAAFDMTTWSNSSWWMYCAAPLGVCYIASTILLLPKVGAGPFFIALVAGQLVGSAAIDATGAFSATRRPVTLLRGFGILTVVVAAGASQLPISFFAHCCSFAAPSSEKADALLAEDKVSSLEAEVEAYELAQR